MIYHFNISFIGHTCSSDLQWETSCNRSPTRLSESLWVKMVLSSRSLISLTASLLMRSDWLRELSALKYFNKKLSRDLYWCNDEHGIWRRLNCSSGLLLPVIMTHIRCLPISRWELICRGSHGSGGTISTTSIASHWTWHCHFGSGITTVSTSCMQLCNKIGISYWM